MKVELSSHIKEVLRDENESNNSDFVFKTVILPEQFRRKGFKFTPRIDKEKNEIRFFINGKDKTKFINENLASLKRQYLRKPLVR